MKISELRELLKDKRVIEEINKHLWIESQKAGYSIGIERATDEWLKLYAEGWLKYNKPERYRKMRSKKGTKPKRRQKKAVRKRGAKKGSSKTKRKRVSKRRKKKR